MATPRWFTALSEALSKYPKSSIYSVATVDASSGSAPIPRVRNIVHREFIVPARSAEPPLLVSTTDIRTPKIQELASITEGHPNAEIVWWIAEANEQYRFSGTMHVLPEPHHPLAKTFPRDRLKPEIGATEADTKAWWEAERVKVFNEKMGPALRAGFCRPTPGSKMDRYEEGEGWPTTLPKSYEVPEGDEKVKAQVEEALKTFALMVLEPNVVELVELGVVPNRRTRYEKNEDGWEENIVVP